MKTGWKEFGWSWLLKGREFQAGYEFAYSALTSKEAGITVAEMLDFAEDRWITSNFKEGLRAGIKLFIAYA